MTIKNKTIEEPKEEVKATKKTTTRRTTSKKEEKKKETTKKSAKKTEKEKPKETTKKITTKKKDEEIEKPKGTIKKTTKKGTKKTELNVKEITKKTTVKEKQEPKETKKIEKYQKTFCEKCDEFVDYTITFGKIKESIGSTEVVYDGFVCECDICGEFVDPLNVYEFNNKILDREYRKKEGILQQEEIIELIVKSKKSLHDIANITGLSEFSLGTYFLGTRPTKKNSQSIEKHLSPKYKMSSNLLNNK